MRRSNLFIGLAFLFSAALAAQGPARRPGIVEVKREASAETPARAVEAPGAPIWRADASGRPIVSSAGYVQLADEGPGFYYGALVEDRVAWARSIGLVGTNNWGDVEAMALTGRIVARWRKLHPDVRLGIDEISSEFGGFPDYDADGASDHLTHQFGLNINFLVPCRKRPERYVHLGVMNDPLYDAGLYLDMFDLIADGGALRMTTNRTLVISEADGTKLRSRLPFKETAKRADGYSSTWSIEGRRTTLYLLVPKGDHSDHVNALMWRPE